MTIKTHCISVEKTLFVVTYGNISAPVFWLILHGYGQHAEAFQKEFSILNEKENYCVFPEAPHRFYLKSGKGDTGASWMTKYQREADIKDNNAYLNKVYTNFILPYRHSSVRLNVLGFSQGAATLVRWLSQSNVQVDKLILWGAVFPPDMQKEEHLKILKNYQWYYFIGKNDEFISNEEKTNQKNFFKQHAFNIKWIEYKGQHALNTSILLSHINDDHQE